MEQRNPSVPPPSSSVLLTPQKSLLATSGKLVEQLAKLAETVQLREEQIKTIAQVLQQMMASPPEPPKRRIGFQSPAQEQRAR
jgi:hypothetical protein